LLNKKKANRIDRWKNETVVCIASGPSLTKEDVEFVRNRARIIAVNREYEIAPWADVCYAADYAFWKTYLNLGLRDVFHGELWTVTALAAREFGINCIAKVPIDGYSPIKNTITTGGNSGYQAIHLAAYWGARRIILLGYDMQRTGGKEHHYGRHAGGLRNGRNFRFWIRRMVPLLRDLKAMGVEVLNASRVTAIPPQWAEQVDLENIAW
jgi:hypothetical protein